MTGPTTGGAEGFVERGQPLVEDAVLRARPVHEPYEIEHRVVRADGSTCVVEAHGAAVLDAAGAAVHVHGGT